MNFYGRAEEVAQKILEQFATGNLAKALAPVFIKRKDGVPCRDWSWGNQLVCVLNGTGDARGMRQWNELQRYVKKGTKPFQILVPLIKKAVVEHEETAERRTIEVVYGFGTAPVYRFEDTDGAELPDGDPELERWLDDLPLVEVARSWGLKVSAKDGRKGEPHGIFIPNKEIALKVKDVNTFAHELIHAADLKLNNLKERGQHWRSETVAELGAAILLASIGLPEYADYGGSWKYIEAYAKAAELDPIQTCMWVIKRTCNAVNFLLSEAEKLAEPQPA